MTKSPCIARRLAMSQCKGQHQHESLVGCKAHHCQVYPEAFCDEIHFAMQYAIARSQRFEDANIKKIILAALIQEEEKHPYDDVEDFYHLYHGNGIYDDISSRPCDKDRVALTRTVEIGLFRTKMGGVHQNQQRRSHAIGSKDHNNEMG